MFQVTPINNQNIKSQSLNKSCHIEWISLNLIQQKRNLKAVTLTKTAFKILKSQMKTICICLKIKLSNRKFKLRSHRSGGISNRDTNRPKISLNYLTYNKGIIINYMTFWRMILLNLFINQYKNDLNSIILYKQLYYYIFF